MQTIDTIIEQWQNEGFNHDKLMAMACIARIKRANVLLINALEKQHKQNHDIAMWEFDVLATLRRAGKPYCLSPTELFASMMITSGAMTNRLQQLEKKALITRIANPKDARSLLVQLSEKGLALIDKAIVEHIELENQLLSGLDTEEMATLNTLLRKLGQTLSMENNILKNKPTTTTLKRKAPCVFG